MREESRPVTDARRRGFASLRASIVWMVGWGLAASIGGCAATRISPAAGELVVGPHALASEGWPHPKDFAELSAWVADPLGPKAIELEGHSYLGNLQIKRALHLRGTPDSVLDGERQGTVLTLEGAGIVVENLSVRGSGRRHTTEDGAIRAEGSGVVIANVAVFDSLFGISLQRCHGCVVRANHVRGRDDDPELRGDGIKLWESQDSRVENNLVEDSRDVVVWYSRRVHLDGNTIRRSRYGTHFMYAHDGVVTNEHLIDNVVGIFAMYSSRLIIDGNVLAGARGAAGVGLGFKECDGATVRGNFLVGNSTGVYLDRSPRSEVTPVVIEGNVFGIDDVAVRLHSGQDGVFLRANDFQGNGRLVDVEGGGDAMRITFDGNYLSEYAGYDLNGDGVGDVAFEKKRLGSDLVESHPAAQLLEGTVALGIVDAVAMAIPVLATKKLFVDLHPAMRPHRSETSP